MSIADDDRASFYTHGFEVEGLDCSADMLERCREEARRRGLEVTLHLQLMQEMALDRRYRAIFLAGASFTLLSDEQAPRALERIHAHLEPGGSALIPLELPDPDSVSLGRFSELCMEDGTTLRAGGIEYEIDAEQRHERGLMRYERTHPGQAPEVVERQWLRTYWDQERFADMLRAAGFARVTPLDPRGGRASPSARVFVFLASKA